MEKSQKSTIGFWAFLLIVKSLFVSWGAFHIFARYGKQ